jgi:DNA-binding LytR/AlgR family response regulator
MDNITSVIVEDNPLDAAYLQQQLTLHKILLNKGVFNNAMEANAYIKEFRPEVLFLDIDMPVMNGIDFFKTIQYDPVCVFVTAHPDYAVESYEAKALDFILKPVKMERLKQVVDRIVEYKSIKTKSKLYDTIVENDFLIIKEGATKHRIQLNDILYIEALKDYSKVVTLSKKILTLSKLKQFLEKLPTDKFTRVHRSYAIAINKIDRSDTNDIYIREKQIPIGKTFKQSLKFLL